MEIKYPSKEGIIEINMLILSTMKIKKADKAEVLSHWKIIDLIEECKECDGSIYDKAAVLMRGIVKKHPFASGNRRTAFVVTKEFLIKNNKKFKIKDNSLYANAMQGIREDYYTHNEIKTWIKNGNIKEFKR